VTCTGIAGREDALCPCESPARFKTEAEGFTRARRGLGGAETGRDWRTMHGLVPVTLPRGRESGSQ